jgi:hypothetical protein
MHQVVFEFSYVDYVLVFVVMGFVTLTHNQHMKIQRQPDAYQYNNMHIGDFS